jgi:hypothetical protein
MTTPLDIRQHDALFASRTTPDEWARIAAFRNLPEFLDGVMRHEGAMQPFFAGNRFLNKIVVERWRYQILVFTLYLHITRDPADPRTGLTVANLQKICGQLGLASPGRVYAFLNIMKLGGYLSSERSTIDSRVVHMAPTPRFMTIVEEWNDHIFAAIDAGDPAAGLTALRARHPALGEMMRTSGGRGLLGGWSPLGPFPETDFFASVDGGWSLMEYVVGQMMRQERGVVLLTPVDCQLRSKARDFGGSRTNLLRLLESGYEEGLLAEPPRGGNHVLFSSRMVCSYLGFIASYLSNFQRHAAIGLGQLQVVEAQAA